MKKKCNSKSNITKLYIAKGSLEDVIEEVKFKGGSCIKLSPGKINEKDWEKIEFRFEPPETNI